MRQQIKNVLMLLNYVHVILDTDSVVNVEVNIVNENHVTSLFRRTRLYNKQLLRPSTAPPIYGYTALRKT